MSKVSMRVLPEEMRGVAGDVGRLGGEADQVRGHLQRSWGRLDAGWQSYAKGNVEGLYRQAMGELHRMGAMLDQMGRAVHQTADLIVEADQAAVAFFGDVGVRQRTGGRPPGLASPAYRGEEPPPDERPDLAEEFEEFKRNRGDYAEGEAGAGAGVAASLASVAGVHLTPQEAELLLELSVPEMFEARDIMYEAFDVQAEYYGEQSVAEGNDGVSDAFRHAYWSGRLAQEFGEDWARRFTDTHESVPGNPAARDFMDRWNNDLGIRIAVENPDATPEELAELIHEAIENGEGVYIPGADQLPLSSPERIKLVEDGPLAYTDQEPSDLQTPVEENDAWDGRYRPE